MFLFPRKIEEFGFLLVHKNAVEDVVHESDRDGHHGQVEVVVAAAKILQQADSPDIEQIREKGHSQESEQQFVVLVLEDQHAVRLEIEQNADDGCQEIGNHVGMVEFEQMLEDEQEDVIDEQPECRVQHGNQHEPDELRFKIAV